MVLQLGPDLFTSSERASVATAPPPDGHPDDSSGSVTAWIDGLKGGDRDAARRLWSRYFRLWGSERLASDEEDVALSAFKSFCRAAEAGRFEALNGRDEFWRLLAHLMSRKAADQIAREKRWKRGGKAVRKESETLDSMEAAGPPPDVYAEMAEEFQRLLERLPDPSLQTVAVMKLEGHTTAEIARRLDLGERTVVRKLWLIRRWWSEGQA
jgi:DNA-directed RNA polymerase specialized sigma24 family protein